MTDIPASRYHLTKSFIVEQVPLNYNKQRAIKGIIEELTCGFPFIKKIILYGSKARGDFIEDSDID